MRSVVRILAIAVLLLAQQAALSHPLRHLDGQAGDPKQERLCDFHGALGSLLGAADGNRDAVDISFRAPAAIDDAHEPLISAAGPTPSSRDPPQAF